jgi:hypothetical protein
MTIKVIFGSQQDYNNAINYLKRESNKACALIMQLNMVPDPIHIIVKENYYHNGIEGSRYIPPEKSQSATIHWWVYDWTDVGETTSGTKKFMNPAMALIHELGHAFQHYKRGLKMKRSNVVRVERDNIQNYETPIAIELGQPYRKTYKDSYPMGNQMALFIKMGKGPMLSMESFDNHFVHEHKKTIKKI